MITYDYLMNLYKSYYLKNKELPDHIKKEVKKYVEIRKKILNIQDNDDKWQIKNREIYDDAFQLSVLMRC